jgi:uncharacterized protein
VPADLLLSLFLASVAAFGLRLSAVAGFGGGVLLLPVFTALFGLRAAVPMLTVTQLSSNGARVWLNRHQLRWPMIGWFALGTVPACVAGGILLTRVPPGTLQRILGAFLIVLVVWRRLRPTVARIATPAFAGVGLVSGLGSALLGSVGPLTAPFFLAAGLTRAAYIGIEAASALIMHLTKLATYGAGQLLTPMVRVYGIILTSAVILGSWVGRNIVHRISDHVFVLLVQIGLVAAGLLLIIGF